MDYMTSKQWSLNGLQFPPAVHICVTLRHTEPGVADRFIADLKSEVAYVKTNPDVQGMMGPIYGMAANVSFSGMLDEFLKVFLDLVYEV